ncbi:SRPBCC domain-containing protein [Microbacterium sp. 4R-513]|uniref:SRPBCC family protein n=1 Tax=Microbacterium sp. 4R-513 TaxID=2567934 RepID=UPI0013E1B5B8|nr:SRPBCC domain-containing protein [Microbacterium sp. 4R-513]QIG39010.1 SRPBCC domain-containing protein [Microbacterium sp. 4R-513]
MASLTIDRDFDADPARVWRALTEASELQRWFWPPRLSPSIETDPRLGGSYRIASDAAQMGVTGEYRVFDPPSALSYSWRWDGEDEVTFVTIQLSPDGDGTHLRLTHDGFRTSEGRDENAKGWQDCLERLPSFLESPGPRDEK